MQPRTVQQPHSHRAATVSNATGVVLKSTEFGSSQFVSIKVSSDGGINNVASGAGANAGIYTLSSLDENVAVAASLTTFVSATNPDPG